MNLSLVKTAATLIASAGIGAIVTNAVKATTPEDLKLYSKITVVVGTVVASRAIGGLASTYASKQIDELAAGYTQIKSAIQASRKKQD